MNTEVILTCALTGAGDTVGKSEHVPVTPEQIKLVEQIVNRYRDRPADIVAHVNIVAPRASTCAVTRSSEDNPRS